MKAEEASAGFWFSSRMWRCAEKIFLPSSQPPVANIASTLLLKTRKLYGLNRSWYVLRHGPAGAPALDLPTLVSVSHDLN